MNTPKKLLSLALVCGMALTGCSGGRQQKNNIDRFRSIPPVARLW